MKRFHLILLVLLVALLGLKGFYVWGVIERRSRLPVNLLDEAAFSMVVVWAAWAIERLAQRWLRATLKAALTLGVATVVALYAAIVLTHAIVGSFPRWQWLAGLTWKTIGPSLVPMLMQSKGPIALGLLAAGLGVVGLWKARLPRWRLNWKGALALTLGVFALELASTRLLGRIVHVRERELLERAFTRDLDEAGAGAMSLAEELEWFRAHDERLRSAEGREPVYGDLLERQRGKNIVLVSLESVRARDLPPYGGKALMPWLASMSEHCVTLDRLYSQDIRSTKTFAAFEMGLYELITWESYSHGLTRRFKEESLATRLKALGYRTHAMVNGDPNYDANADFHVARGYDDVQYQPEINPGTTNADDNKLLARVDAALAKGDAKPEYFLLWPFATHHPYGREYWADIDGWQARHPEGIEHKGAEDHQRYLAALGETDEFLSKLWATFQARGKSDVTFFFVGDHGEAFGEHDPRNVFHGNNVFEESVRVAGIVCSPGLTRGGVDPRTFMLKDLPASILNLAGQADPVFGNGRSVFAHYTQPMPAYLFNSFTRTTGIVADGLKYRTSLDQPNQRFFASLADIAQDPDAELRPLQGDPSAAPLAIELEGWLKAMQSRTRRLLSDTTRQVDDFQIRDDFRVYCDEGHDFVEGVKAMGSYHLVGDDPTTVQVTMKRSCQRLRLAPLLQLTVPDDVNLRFALDELEVVTADGKTLGLRDLAFEQVLAADANGTRGFTMNAGQSSSGVIDYRLGPSPVPVSTVKVTFSIKAKKFRPRR